MDRSPSPLQEEYLDLGRKLAQAYPQKSFQNHCYWRIALDNTLGGRWDELRRRPAYRHLSPSELQQAVRLLQAYLEDETLLLRHNNNSLRWRGKVSP